VQGGWSGPSVALSSVRGDTGIDRAVRSERYGKRLHKWRLVLMSVEVEEVPGRWPVEKANAWYDALPWLVGCNYIPASAVNQLEMWQSDTFDLETMAGELDWAERLGFNTLRVFLHDLLWKQDAEGLWQRMDRFLDLCRKRSMRILFVFFDSCHRPDPRIGMQPPCVREYHNSGWVQSPSEDLLLRYHNGTAGDGEKKRLKGYVQETLRRFSTDERVLAWELFNEPGQDGKGDAAAALLLDAWKWAREANPSQPVCSTAEGSVGQLNIDIARVNSDMVSFHCYDDAKLETIIRAYEETGRPVLCTEYMSRPSSTFAGALPVLLKHRAAAYNWGFVSGKTGTIWPWSLREGKDVYQLRKEESHVVQPHEPFPEPDVWFHDIYRIDGTPFSESEIALVRKITGMS